MADQDDQDGPTGRAWWMDALDPVENLRALVNAQGFGRRAAEDLADRLLGGGNRRTAGAVPDGALPDGALPDGTVPDDTLDEMIGQLREDAARAGELSARVIEHLATLLGAVARGQAGGSDRTPAMVELPAVTPGGETNGLFWIHNTTAVPVAAVRPHTLGLRSHLGDELPAEAVRFDPVVLDPLPARSSCGIDVRVCVPAAARPGVYVSIILVANVPEMHLPLRVTVQPPVATP